MNTKKKKILLDWWSGGSQAPVIPIGAILEPDAINYLFEPNGDYVLEP